MPRLRRRPMIILGAAVLLVGAAVRLVALSDLPPGLHFDEAANGSIVRAIAFDGYRPVFIPDFTGKEVLWFYLAAIGARTVGDSIFALRLTSALLGVLTIAVGGWSIRELYAGDDRRDRLALLTMAVLAGAFWLAVLNRIPFRANTQPLMQALTLGLLFRALRFEGRQRIALVAGAGVCAGLTGYTYLAARLFPVALVILFLALAAFSRRVLPTLRDLAVFGAAAAAAFAPLGIYFLNNPERFLTRIEQVAPQGSAAVLDGWWRAALMLFVEGDPLLRFNLPGKPIFGPVLAIAFVAGVVVLIRDLLRDGSPAARARNVLLLVWPVVFLAPTALATGSVTPSNLRAVGLAPYIALVPALGLLAAFRAAPRLSESQAAAGALVGIVVAAGAAGTAISLSRWSADPRLHYDYDAHIAALARAVDAVPFEGPVYIGTIHFRHPTALYVADREMNHLFGGEALVLPPEGEALLAISRDAGFPADWHAGLSGYLVESPPGPDGVPQYRLYRIDESIPVLPPSVEPVNFGGIVRLDGLAAHEAVSGDVARVDALWTVTGQPARTDLVFAAEVCDAWGWCWVRANADGSVERGRGDSYLSSEWRPGERILTRIAIPLPEGIPPGDYSVRLRVFSTGEGTALPIVGEDGRYGGLSTQLGEVAIRAAPVSALEAIPIQYRLDDGRLTEGIRLVGYDMPVTALRQGEALPLALYWLAEQAAPPEQAVTLTWGDTILLRRDPVHSSHPTPAWTANELVVDRYQIPIPKDLPAGTRPLLVQIGASERVPLGDLTIEAVARDFSLPADPLAEEVAFGEAVALAAIEVAPDAVPGESLAVRLVWQALDPPAGSYTVFVHLLDAAGQIVAQQDRQPHVGGRPYPPDLWVPGEVVADDPYMLSLPAELPGGPYRLRIGWYVPETGDILPVGGDAFAVLPIQIEGDTP